MFRLDSFRDKTKIPYHPMACLISLKIRNQNNVEDASSGIFWVSGSSPQIFLEHKRISKSEWYLLDYKGYVSPDFKLPHTWV